MVLNRKEWETVDRITAILLKYRHLLNDREKQTFLDFYGLTIEATQRVAAITDTLEVLGVDVAALVADFTAWKLGRK